MNKITVLIVEDHDRTARRLKERFEALGYGADIAETGDLALAMLGKSHYDAIILDLHLGNSGVQGTDILQHLKLENSPIARLVLTGDPDCKTQRAALCAGADTYVLKPNDMEDLLAVTPDMTVIAKPAGFGVLVTQFERMLTQKGLLHTVHENSKTGARFDVDTGVLTGPGGKTVRFNERETIFVTALFNAKGHVLHLYELERQVRGSEDHVEGSIYKIKSSVNDLAKSVGIDELIVNQRGAGYALNI